MKTYKNYYLLLFAFLFTPFIVNAQLTATFNQTTNTKCNGSDCNYTGPTIMINEIMVAPTTFDGSIAGDDVAQRGE